VYWSLPSMSTTIASSPNCFRNESVAFAESLPLPTRVSVEALGSSRSARARPITASAPTTHTVATG